MRVSRRVASIVAGIAVVAMIGLVSRSRSQDRAAGATGSRLSVTREDDRSFNISRPDAPALRVTFLSPTAFRVHVLTDEQASLARLADYMRVRSDSSYPPVAMKAETADNAVTFSTPAIGVHLRADERIISLAVRTPAAAKERSWLGRVGLLILLTEVRPCPQISWSYPGIGSVPL